MVEKIFFTLTFSLALLFVTNLYGVFSSEYDVASVSECDTVNNSTQFFCECSIDFNSENTKPTVTCYDVNTTKTLGEIVELINSSKLNVGVFRFDGADLPYLLDGMFNVIQAEIVVIANSRIDQLSNENNDPFKNSKIVALFLENTSIDDITGLETLSNQLQALSVLSTKLDTRNLFSKADFPNLLSLELINSTQVGSTFELALPIWSLMTSLRLESLGLNFVSRIDIPQKVTTLILSYNKIEFLEVGVLQGLAQVVLDRNGIRTLNQQQLEEFDGELILTNNPLECGNLLWLKQLVLDKQFRGLIQCKEGCFIEHCSIPF